MQIQKRNDIYKPINEHVYFNAVIRNTSTNAFQLARYNESSTTAILQNPSEYYCSIIRFDVPVEQIPIFSFADGSYSVTLSNGATDYKTDLLYVPNYTPNISAQDDRSVYSYQQFVDSINNALQTSMTALTAGLPAYNGATNYGVGALVQSASIAYISLQTPNTGNTPASSAAFWSPIRAPYMTFDINAKLFTINASTGFYNSAFIDSAQPLKLWFNTQLWVFFGNFYKLYNSIATESYNTNGKNFQIIIKPLGNNSITLSPTFGGGAGYAMTQEFVSVSSWTDFLGLVFVTNTIPIKYENAPSTLIGANKSGLITSSQPILTDFEAQTDGPIRNHLQYFAPGEYRLVDMTGTTPLTNLDIQIFYQTKDGILNPLYLNPLDVATVKILFRKKDINVSYSH